MHREKEKRRASKKVAGRNAGKKQLTFENLLETFDLLKATFPVSFSIRASTSPKFLINWVMLVLNRLSSFNPFYRRYFAEFNLSSVD